MIRRRTGLIVKVTADPFGDPVVNTHWVKGAPVEEYKAAATFHLPLNDLEMVADVERMILLVAVGAIRSHEDCVGVVQR